MYLILAKEDKRIIHISADLGYQDNGNYLVDGGTLAIPPSICDMVQVDAVPAGVEIEKYLYVDGAFVENPNWVDPRESEEMTPDEILAILDGEGEGNGDME